MHNRRRNPQGLSPTEIEAKARKIKTFTSLTSGNCSKFILI